MKLEPTHAKSATKTFTIAGTALRVTDPCYSIDTWCAETLYGVLPGTWYAHVGYDDPAQDIERALLRHALDHEACRNTFRRIRIWAGRAISKGRTL